MATNWQEHLPAFAGCGPTDILFRALLLLGLLSQFGLF